MRSVKTHGGLTRVKGMTSNQHLLLVLSMPICANIDEDMQKYTSISYQTSDQHIGKLQMLKTLSLTVDLISYLRAPDPIIAIKLHCLILPMACQLMKVLLLTMQGRLGKIFFHPWLDNLLTTITIQRIVTPSRLSS